LEFYIFLVIFPRSQAPTGNAIPSELFEKVFKDLLPSLRTAWHSRNKPPLPENIQFTLSRFEKIWIVDGSTLEALFRKLQSLEEAHYGQLAPNDEYSH
jgi:hypothetical protein